MESKWFDKGDVIAVVIAVLSNWFFGGKSTTASAAADGEGKQKIVSMLQALLGKVDEGMWASLISTLAKPEKKLMLTQIMELLDRYGERDSFRLAMVNAPVGSTTILVDDPNDKSKGTPKKQIEKTVENGEYSEKDRRVIFLKDIVELGEDPNWGPEAVCFMLRTHKLATENVVAKRALAFWQGTLAWMKKQAVDFFRVQSFEQITTELIAKHLSVLARKVPYRPDSDVNPGFWQWAFRRHWILASILVLGVVILAWRFYAITSIS